MSRYSCTKSGPIRASSGKIVAFVDNPADREGVILELNALATERDLLATALNKLRDDSARAIAALTADRDRMKDAVVEAHAGIVGLRAALTRLDDMNDEGDGSRGEIRDIIATALRDAPEGAVP